MRARVLFIISFILLAISPARATEDGVSLSTPTAQIQADLQLLQRIAGPDWPRYATPEGWLTPKGRDLVDKYRAQQTAWGRLPAVSKLDLPRKNLEQAHSSLADFFDGDWQSRAVVRNGQVYSVQGTRGNVTVEAGQFGIGSQSVLLDTPSPYFSVTSDSHSDPHSRHLDTRVASQLGWIELNSRLFADRGPAIPNSPAILETLQRLGLSSDQVTQFADNNLSYSNAPQTASMLFGSAVVQAGRAYALAGPFDAAWAVGDVTRIVHIALNTAGDATGSLRWRGPGTSVELHGGLAANVSAVDSHVIAEAAAGKPKLGFILQPAPHATVALRGQIPGSETSYSISQSARFNPDTTVKETHGSLWTTVGQRVLSFSGLYSIEQGESIGFRRKKIRAQVTADLDKSDEYHQGGQYQAYVSAGSDQIEYGTAQVDSKSVIAGLEIQLGADSRVAVEQFFNHRRMSLTEIPPDLQEAVKQFGFALGQGVMAQNSAGVVQAMLNAGSPPPAAPPSAAPLAAAPSAAAPSPAAPSFSAPPTLIGQVTMLASTLAQLDPQTVDSMFKQLNAQNLNPTQKAAVATFAQLALATLPQGSPQQQALGDVVAQNVGTTTLSPTMSTYGQQHSPDLAALATLLSDADLWKSVLIRYGRTAAIKVLAKKGSIGIPVMGTKIKIQLNAAEFVGMIVAVNSWLDPLAPAKASDVHGMALRLAAKQLGLAPSQANPEAIAQKVSALTGQQTMRIIAQQNYNGPYNPQKTADQIFTTLTPSQQASMGPNASKLLALLPPANSTPAEVNSFMHSQMSEVVGQYLQAQNPGLAQQVSQALALAESIAVQETNMLLLQLMLAAEEFDRVTVDHGVKIPDLNVQFAQHSLDTLIEREHGPAEDMQKMCTRAAALAVEDGQKRLREQFKEYGRSRLAALQAGPAWPRGLRLAVDEDAWPGMLAAYDADPIFSLIDCIARRFPAGQVTLKYDPAAPAASVWKDPTGVWITLPRPNPKMSGDSESILDGLDDKISP